MKGLGIGNKSLQHNIADLFLGSHRHHLSLLQDCSISLMTSVSFSIGGLNYIGSVNIGRLLFQTSLCSQPYIGTIWGSVRLNSFQPSIAFHIETSHLICNANPITSFYMKWNTGLIWFKGSLLILAFKSLANIYLFKVNKRNTRKRCEKCSKLAIKRPNQNNVKDVVLVFLLLTSRTSF